MARKPAQLHTDLRKVGENGRSSKWEGLTKAKRGSVTWADAQSDMLKGAIAAATEDGAGLLLSKTSDGGALSIYVLSDAATQKLYPATAEELHEALSLIYQISNG
jgi:hypothetical protein